MVNKILYNGRTLVEVTEKQYKKLHEDGDIVQLGPPMIVENPKYKAEFDFYRNIEKSIVKIQVPEDANAFMSGRDRKREKGIKKFTKSHLRELVYDGVSVDYEYDVPIVFYKIDK